MPQFVIYMKVNAHNKDCYNLKNIVSNAARTIFKTIKTL